MNIDTIRRDNLRHQLDLLKKKGVSREEFANSIGSSKSSFSQICGKNPSRNIGDDIARRVEVALKLDYGWMDKIHDDVLYEGNHVGDEIKTINKPMIEVNAYPLLSAVQAGMFTEVLSCTLSDSISMISSYKKPVGKAFWLKVDGDSMTSPIGFTPSFPSGVMILVDTGVLPENGQFCVAIKDNQATFKKYSIEEGIHYLKPLNPEYKKAPIDDNCRIIGKVIEARWEDF